MVLFLSEHDGNATTMKDADEVAFDGCGWHKSEQLRSLLGSIRPRRSFAQDKSAIPDDGLHTTQECCRFTWRLSFIQQLPRIEMVPFRPTVESPPAS